MNYFSLLPLAAFLMNSFAWVFVYAQKSRSRPNRHFLVFAAMMSLWCLADYLSWAHAPDSLQPILIRIKPLLWLPLGFLFVRFTYAYVRRRHDAPYYLILALVSAAIAVHLPSDLLFRGFERRYWGVRPTPGPLYLPVTVGLLVLPASYAIFLLIVCLQQTQNKETRDQLRVLIIGMSLLLPAGFITDVGLPEIFHIQGLPQLAPSLTGIFTLAVLRAARHYNFLALMLEEAGLHAFRDARDGILLLNPQGEVVQSNRAAAAMLAFTTVSRTRSVPATAHQRSLGLPLARILESPERARGRSRYEVAFESDDGARHISVTESVIAKSSTEVGRLLLIRDVTEKRKSVLALERSEARYRTLFNSTSDAILVFPLLADGEPGTFVELNEVARRILELHGDSAIRLRLSDMIAVADHGRLAAGLCDLCATQPLRLEVVAKPRASEPFPVELVANRFALLEGPAVLVTLRDIRERRAVELKQAELARQLEHAQKMEAVGALASGFAHDMNNVLGSIMTVGSLGLVESVPDDPRRRDLAEIVLACKRGRALTEKLLGFARKDQSSKQPMQVAPVIDEVLALLRRTTPPGIAIRANIEPDLPEVVGDASQLSHMLMNLCLNAIDALDGAGQLCVVAKLADDQGPDGTVARAASAPGSQICLMVTDTGNGMDPATAARAFEPFFTTKPKGKGTGLGLAIVAATVRDHGGTVCLRATLGQGTAVTVLLPVLGAERTCETPAGLALGKSANDLAASCAMAPLSSARRVLLVDDDELMLGAAKRLLSLLGYKTVALSSSAEALAYETKPEQPFVAAVLDISMPGLDGLGLLSALRQSTPFLPAVLCSGHMRRDAAITRACAQPAVEFLQKPYTIDELEQSLNRVLTAAPAPPYSLARS